MNASDIPVIDVDVLVIGGGTAGPMAAVTAKEQDPNLRVMLLEKANVKRSGAISMGMDGLNNAIVPGHSTPEQYVKEITIEANTMLNMARTMILPAALRYQKDVAESVATAKAAGVATPGGIDTLNTLVTTIADFPPRSSSTWARATVGMARVRAASASVRSARLIGWRRS